MVFKNYVQERYKVEIRKRKKLPTGSFLYCIDKISGKSKKENTADKVS
ncbi:hypothetical protein QF044_001832 [Chryseobacterium sp. W4I1]|nr:hypothetical protein [Chryseobacterium sp. W4I1]